ncbi:MAG: hypothetical protein JSR76_06270 [Verrucomicrobia bacterium]|nr:hypothetical protein [Verrucomicrobiota bacterium]
MILTSSGGTGHLQAAKVKRQEIEERYPGAKIIQKDLLLDWIGPFGGYCTKLWDTAQLSGNAAALDFFGRAQKYLDFALGVPIFCAALRTFLEEEIDAVIDTQPLATKSIIKAIRYVKWRTGKEISFEKVVTDLPTKNTTHFFRPIRKLSLEDRKRMRLLTTHPLLEEGETETSFWQEQCHLSKDSICYTTFPLRKAFREYAQKDSKEKGPLSLEIKIISSYEADLLQKAIALGSLPITRTKNSIFLKIEPTDKVSLLMLGSNPHEEAILSYLDHFINEIQKRDYKNRRDLFFIFCSPKRASKSLLQEHILRKIETTLDYPRSLTVLPLPYQEDDVIAPLFHRSDASITRSGGLTAMEHLSVSSGQIWIHKSDPPKTLPPFFVLGKSGMPSWERGNADYLAAKRGARLITPETFPTLCASYFPAE